MNEGIAIQDNDVVVTKVVNQFWVWQQFGKSRKRLDGPFADRAEAESRARQLADHHESDAWFETESEIATLL
jgi:hypothetical protein